MDRYSAITLLDVLLSKFESLVCHGEHVTIDISIQQEQSVDCFANALWFVTMIFFYFLWFL